MTGKRKGRPRSKDIDWATIERLYVEGEMRAGAGDLSERALPSYADLAQRFGLRTASVADRGRIGGWPRKREEFTRSLTARAHQKTIETVSTVLADATRKTLAVGDKLVKELDDFITRRVTPDAEGKAVGLDADDFNKLSSALKRLVETRRIELGLDPPDGNLDAPATEDPVVREATRMAVAKLLEGNAKPAEGSADPSP